MTLIFQIVLTTSECKYQAQFKSILLKRRDTLLEKIFVYVKNLGKLKVSGELGIATAEYAVTTVAACGFAGVLYKLLSSESIAQLIGDLLRRALSTFLL